MYNMLYHYEKELQYKLVGIKKEVLRLITLVLVEHIVC